MGAARGHDAGGGLMGLFAADCERGRPPATMAPAEGLLVLPRGAVLATGCPGKDIAAVPDHWHAGDGTRPHSIPPGGIPYVEGLERRAVVM